MKQVVLVGAGHAHAHVLRAWAANPIPGVQMTVVSPHRMAPYSGMVPGWLAGTYRYEEIVIDFAALCAAGGARFVDAEMAALDPDGKALRLRAGPALRYDVLSLNVGSTLRIPDAVRASATVLALRPLSELRPGYEAYLDAWRQDASPRCVRVTAVGGGASGVETVLAVAHRLRSLRPDRQVEVSLVSRGPTLLPGMSPPAGRAAAKALERARVTVQRESAWTTARRGASDLVLWATGAQAHDWQIDPQRRGGLAVNVDGFVRIDDRVRSVSHGDVFAVGDCAHWDAGGAFLPKAGVYAVRMGPVLERNLRAALGVGAARRYSPQRWSLALLATGDGRAVASWGPLGGSGAWAWKLKDHIDRAFVRGFELVAAR